MKLNQVVALVKDRKVRFEKNKTEIYHRFQKGDLATGFTRVFTPKHEDSERLPPENKRVQVVVDDQIKNLRGDFVSLLDTVLTQDFGNTETKASLQLGELSLDNVPVTYLLFLDKQLADLMTLVQAMPVLDQNEQWSLDSTNGLYKTATTSTNKTKVVPEPIVLYDATEHHPAQTQILNKTISDGTWDTTKYSGAITPERKKTIVNRITQLQETVKLAREEANTKTVQEGQIGNSIFDFIFKS